VGARRRQLQDPAGQPGRAPRHRKDRYDQHEVHCTFKSVDAKESDYKIAGDCTVEGNAQSYDFTLTVSGDTLTFTDEAGARDFLRCK
jgi:hypothetical protein